MASNNLTEKTKRLVGFVAGLDSEFGSGVTFQMQIFLSYILGISTKMQKPRTPTAWVAFFSKILH